MTTSQIQNIEMTISRVAVTNICRLLLSIDIMLAIPMFCMYGGFAIYLPKEQIPLQEVIRLTLGWLPFTLGFSLDLIASLVGLEHSGLWIKVAFAATAILVLSGGIYWLLRHSLRTGIAISIWIAATLPLLLIDVVVTLILVEGMILSAGL
jgi:hypothetical protein